jgi:hypothetical protein
MMSMLAGLLTFFAGLAAVVRHTFYSALPGYAYRWSVHSWGWTLLILGIVLFAAGAAKVLGLPGGRIAATGVAALTMIAAFLFLPYSPVWGVVLIALSALAIWALLRNPSGAGGGNGGYGSSGSYGERYGDTTTGTSSPTMSSGTTTTTTTSAPAAGTRSGRRL